MEAPGEHKDAGFALVESVLAATLLVTGLLALGVMLTQAAIATTTTKAREQGVALQRELVEAARAIPYVNLTPNSVAAAIQGAAAAGLADSSTDPGWTVRRRGYTYTVSVGVCSVDDPADGVGAHDPATFCASGAGTTSRTECSDLLSAAGTVVGDGIAAGAGAKIGDCGIDVNADGRVDGLTEADVGLCIGSCPGSGPTDATPDDLKRIVTLVRWDQGTGKRYALQSATVPNPGLSTAPVVTSVSAAGGETITAGTSVSLTATIDREPATVGWIVDGSPAATAASGTGTTWNWSWPLGNVSSATGASPAAGEVLDGSYLVGAKAFDEYGTGSQTRSITLRVNRRRPFAPARIDAGRNGSHVDIEWSAAPERDVEGHRVYRVELGPDTLVCGLEKRTSCRDSSPPIGTPMYYAVAVDRDSAGALREGDPSASDSAGLAATPPGKPGSLSAQAVEDDVVLTWSAASGSVDHYRIYRDGVAYADRYDRTAGTELTFTDTRTNGLPHSYSVSAVDDDLAESAPAGPVSP